MAMDCTTSPAMCANGVGTGIEAIGIHNPKQACPTPPAPPSAKRLHFQVVRPVRLGCLAADLLTKTKRTFAAPTVVKRISPPLSTLTGISDSVASADLDLDPMVKTVS